MSEWEPVQPEVIDDILNEEIDLLSLPERDAYRQFSIEAVKIPCFRSEMYGDEAVYAVARVGDQIVFYDDVEGEFATGEADSDGLLRDWGLCGALGTALGIAIATNERHQAVAGNRGQAL